MNGGGALYVTITTSAGYVAYTFFKLTFKRRMIQALAAALLFLCACGTRTCRLSVSAADYSVSGAKWGSSADEVKRVLDRSASVSADGSVIAVDHAELCRQKAQARFYFVRGVSGTMLNGVTFFFPDGFDQSALVAELEKTLGERDPYYHTASGSDLEAPEENWYWHSAESVGEGTALKYLYKASFATDLDSGMAVLEIDATGYNISRGEIA